MPDEKESASPRPKTRSISFNFSFGKPPNDPRLLEMLRRGETPTDPPAGTEVESKTERFKVEFDGGRLRFGQSDPLEHAVSLTPSDREQVDPAQAELWERLARIAEGTGAFPDTARWQARLNMVVWAIVIALPVGALVLTLVSGEPAQTVAVATFFAALIGAMLRSSIR